MDGNARENCKLETSVGVSVGENQDLLGIKSPTIKHLLLRRLQAAHNVSSKTLGVSVVGKEPIDSLTLPLYKLKDETQQQYVSAIAFKLAKVWQRPTMDIATRIAAHWLPLEGSCHQTIAQRPLEAALDDFTVKVVPPGWIHLQLSDLATAAWLQRLAQTPPWWELESGRVGEWESGRVGEWGSGRRGELPITHHPSPITVFPAQHAHARCCSLLRLAHREGMITLKEPDPDTSPTFWSAIAPNPIPWLDPDGKLRFIHPAERRLISLLLELLDDLYSPSPSSHSIAWDKRAIHLSQVFQSFYSQCRIWGEVKIQAPELAQARLGLIAATQPLLRLLLQELLGVAAPLEL